MGTSRTKFAFEPGDTIPGSPYKIRTFLGAGGHGAVFLAEDLSLGLRVVVKVLHPEYANTSAADRLRKEGRALAALGQLSSSFASILRSDEAVIRVTRSGGISTEARVPYFVMEFINGPRLRDLVATSKQKKQPLAIALVLALAVDIAMALSHAHAAGMVHRDIKPDNIMFHLRERDTPALRIIDFGVIDWSDGSKKETDHGFQGTVKYAAPEQLAEKPVSAATDLYTLGVVLFELLTGRLPFDGDESAVTHGHMRVTPPSILQFRPDAPPALADIVAVLLAKMPEQRTAWLVARAPSDVSRANLAQILAQILEDIRLDVQSANAVAPSLAALLKDVSWRGRAETTQPGRSSGSARRRLSGDMPVYSHDVTAPPLDSLLSGLDAPAFELNRLDRLGPPVARALPADATDPSMGTPVTAPMDGRPLFASVDINKTEEQPNFAHTLPLDLRALRAEHGGSVTAGNLPPDATIETSAWSAVDAEVAAPSAAPRTGADVDTPPPRRLYTTSDVLDAIDEAIDEPWEDDTQWREPLSESELAALPPGRDAHLLDPFFVSDSPTVTSEKSVNLIEVISTARRRRTRNAAIGVTATAAAFMVVALVLGGHKTSWFDPASSASIDSPPSAVGQPTPPAASATMPSATPAPTTVTPATPTVASASAATTTAAPVASAAPRTGRQVPRSFASVGAEPGASKPLGTTPRPPPSAPNDVGEFKTHVDH
jgi:serine/threonine protein kinase